MRNVLGTLAIGLCLSVTACRTPAEQQEDDVDRRPIGAGRPDGDADDLDDLDDGDDAGSRPGPVGPGIADGSGGGGDDSGDDGDDTGADTGDFSDPECTTTVGADDPYYDRFEGTSTDNTCINDADCVVSGCSGEVCAAEELITTCEVLPYQPAGGCGCVEGICSWSVCEE